MEQFTLSVDHPLLRNHRVHGQHILPGLSYIDLIYQIFRKRGHDYRYLELSDVCIYRPVTAAPGIDVQLLVECTEVGDSSWAIAIDAEHRIGPSPTESTRVMTANMARHAHSNTFQTDPFAFDMRMEGAAGRNLNDTYAICRSLGVVHEGFMRGSGSIYSHEDAIYIDIRAEADLGSSFAQMMFHPTLIDGSAVCAGVSCASRDQGQSQSAAFLPLYYEQFRANDLLVGGCFARIPLSSVRMKNDVSYLTIEFFNHDSVKVAELTNLAGKCSRPPEAPAPHFAGPTVDLQQSEFAPLSDTALEIQGLIAKALHCDDPTEVGLDVAYYELGLGSIALVELSHDLGIRLSRSLPPTLFFEHSTIRGVAEYLDSHGGSPDGAAPRSLTGTNARAAPSTVSAPDDVSRRLGADEPSAPHRTGSSDSHDIAIVAMSGVFPKARDIEQFWDNLRAGSDCVTLIPESRWSHDEIFDSHKGRLGRAYCRWGGFIEEMQEFDAGFFNMSAREACITDPHERLFLQTVWNLFESAGYTRESLRKQRDGNVGVYVGAMFNQFGAFRSDLATESMASIAMHSSIANRVSHFFGLNGPSMALDCMCASSGAALYSGFNDLQRGAVGLAVVGGVNLSLLAKKYIGLCQFELIGSSHDSRSFLGGDGYLPAESIGALLLKPLGKAERDGDEIHAIIKSVAMNHSGRGTAYSVPNPVAQAGVIQEALRQAKVDATQISYVEASCNGATLADNAEMAALRIAFGKHAGAPEYCRIGSVKTNIGHPEAASSMPQIIKTVQQLKHAWIPGFPSQSRSFIDVHELAGSAFKLQFESSPWPTSAERAEPGRHPKRVALVNSFGAGGTNVCAVIQEYRSSQVTPSFGKTTIRRPQVAPFSAKTTVALRQVIENAAEFLQSNDEFDFDDIIYTLQQGREAMNVRMALVVQDIAELVLKLQKCLENADFIEARSSSCYFGDADRPEGSVRILMAGAGASRIRAEFESNGAADQLALLWVSGIPIEWDKVARPHRCRFVRMPTYPFTRVRYPNPGQDSPERHTEDLLKPLTASAQVPKVQQPLTQPAAAQGTVATVAPRSELEANILSVWQDVLGADHFGVEDSFLDLGGNSLLGRQITARVEDIYGVELPLRSLIGPRPTVAALALAVVLELAGQNDAEAVVQELDSL